MYTVIYICRMVVIRVDNIYIDLQDVFFVSLTGFPLE